MRPADSSSPVTGQRQASQPRTGSPPAATQPAATQPKNPSPREADNGVPTVQEWLRVLCRMHVLTQQALLGGLEYDELLPLWSKRMRILMDPPPLFAGIKLGVTTKGVTWTTILTARLIAGEGGMVAIGCGEGEKFGPLERGTNLQGALSALCGKMWEHPPLSDLSQDRDRFLLIAHSVKATYDHMARKMELLARLIISKKTGEWWSSTTVVTPSSTSRSTQALHLSPPPRSAGQPSSAASLTVSAHGVAPKQDRSRHRLRHPVAPSDPQSPPILPPAISHGLAGASGAMTTARLETGGMTAGEATNLAVSERGSALVRLCRLCQPRPLFYARWPSILQHAKGVSA